MSITHLTDQDIQQAAINASSLTPELLAHFAQCPHCQARAEVYQLLFKEIEDQPAPQFDFDLHAEVMARLTTPKRRRGINDLWVYFVIITVATGGAISICFWNDLQNYFRGFATFTWLLLACASTVMLGFLLLDLYKTYQRKMKMLELL